MNPTAPITTGTAGIGEITLDPADLRGEGAAEAPVVVVPINIRLNNRPPEATIALLALEADLNTVDGPLGERLAPGRMLDLRLGPPVTSIPQGTRGDAFDLRFRLTQPALERLERRRHRNGGALHFRIRFSATAAWVRRIYNQLPPGQEGDPTVPFTPMHGMLADTTSFWTTGVQDLVFTVEQSTWVDKVLAVVGYDSLRLIEVRLPQGLEGGARAAFGRQLRHLDHLGYVDSISASRAVLEAWEKRIRATGQRTVSQVVGDAQGWDADDPRRRFLDTLWVAAKDMTNATHHEGGRPVPLELTEPETRAHLLLTALLSEWLSAIADPQ